jgi:hypothetical protein
MAPRLNYMAAAPELMPSMMALEATVAASGLEHGLIQSALTFTNRCDDVDHPGRCSSRFRAST